VYLPVNFATPGNLVAHAVFLLGHDAASEIRTQSVVSAAEKADNVKRNGIIIISCLTCFASFFLPCVSYAFNQADLDKLLSTKECQWCDLHNADLSGAKLAGAQLSGANLSGARLPGADLSGANLSSTYLRNADFSGANLSNVYLDKANLTGAEIKDANLSGANLSDAIWTDGTRCDKDSIKECKNSRSNRSGGRNRTLSPRGSGIH
jgi:uncharacterized protein YjbI with pentapeptide repeats